GFKSRLKIAEPGAALNHPRAQEESGTLLIVSYRRRPVERFERRRSRSAIPRPAQLRQLTAQQLFELVQLGAIKRAEQLVGAGVERRFQRRLEKNLLENERAQ